MLPYETFDVVMLSSRLNKPQHLQYWMGLSSSIPLQLKIEEAIAVTDPGLIGVGIKVKIMGRLVLWLTMLKTCLKR